MKSFASALLFLLTLAPALAQSSLPGNQAVRETIDLSGPWNFKSDPETKGESLGWFRNETDKTFWPLVLVPVGFDNCGPGMERYFGTAWFCRQIYIPGSFRDKRIVLHFEGINYNSKIWLNGIPVGENQDAFLPFDLVVDDIVKFDEENTIAVSVNNIRQRGQFPLFEGWYGQGGFLREASIVAMNRAYISETMLVATPHSNPSKPGGHISATISVRNDSEQVMPLAVRIRVADGTGRVLAGLLSPDNTFRVNQAGEIRVEGDIPGVEYWSPDSPALYSVEISLIKDGQVLDQQIRRTGFRIIGIRDSKILVNGTPVNLRGFNRHEDSPRTGMAVDLRQAREDFTKMKQMGCNYVRFCHYPHHPGELDLCDELGLFVLAENAMNEWGHIDHPAPNPAIPLTPEDAPLILENARRTLRKMVARDNHHPSIIIWSVSNENEESRDDVALGNQELIRFGQTLDPSRPWTHVSNSFRKKNWETFYVADDVIVVNVYPTHWYNPTEEDLQAGLPRSTRIMQDTLKKIHDRFPGKPIIVGEYGFPNGDAGEEGARKQAVATEAEFKGLSAPYVAGGALWCFARHPWPWYNVSTYGYVSRDRVSAFPALEVVERLYKEQAGTFGPSPPSGRMAKSGMLFYEPAPDNPAADVWCFKRDSLWYVYTLDGFGQNTIGVAVSPDLMVYERKGVAIPSVPGTWENSLYGGDVFERNGNYYMLYSAPGPGFDNAIGLAESEDLLNWVKYPGNPVMRHPDARWYDGAVPDGMRGGTSCRDIAVIDDASTGEWIYCCFAASTGRGDFYRRGCVGLARSRNLVDWEYLPPLFSPGIYTAMEVPRVCKIGNKWFLTWLHAPWYGIRTDEDYGQRAYSWGETMIHYAVADNPLGPYRLPEDPTLFRGYMSPYVIDLIRDGRETLVSTTMFRQKGEHFDDRERCGLMPAMPVRQSRHNPEKLEVLFPQKLRPLFSGKIALIEPLKVNNPLEGFNDVVKENNHLTFSGTSNRIVELTGSTGFEIIADVEFNVDSGRVGLITRYDGDSRSGCVVLVDPERKELQFAELAPIYEKGIILKVRDRFSISYPIKRKFKLSVIQSINYNLVFIDDVLIGTFSFARRDEGVIGLFLENAVGKAFVEGVHAYRD